MNRTYSTALRLDEFGLALSPRDWAILNTLADYRLASGHQLKRWHFPAHVTPEAQARAARRALRRLADLGLLDYLERRVGGVRAGSSGLAWHLSRTGWRLLARNRARTTPARLNQAEPTYRSTDHTLAVTEVAVRLHEAVAKGDCELIDLTPEPGCWRGYLSPYGGTLTLKPDLFAVTARPQAEYEDVWFLEVDRATESRATLLRKADQYEVYRRSGREQQAQGVYPHVVWLTPNQSRADLIHDTLAHKGPDLHLTMTLDQFIATVCGQPRHQTVTEPRSRIVNQLKGEPRL